MPFRFWPIFRIKKIKNFTDTDWLEGQEANGGDSFRGLAASLRGLPAQSPTGTGFVHVTGGVTDPAARAVDLATVDVTGILGCAHLPAFTGDVVKNASSCVQALAIVNADVGTFTNTTVTADAKGRILAISSGAGGGGIQSQTVDIAGADLQDRITPGAVDIVTAQGAGTIILPVAILFEGLFNTTEFTDTPNFTITYGGAPGTDESVPNVLAQGVALSPSLDVLKGTDNRFDICPLQPQYNGTGFATIASSGAQTWQSSADLTNKALVFGWDEDEGDPDGADSTLRITTWFLVRTL